MSSNEIDKHNIILDQNIAGVPDDIIAGVPYDDDPRPDIEAAGIPDDNLVGVPIAVFNDEQQQELENNENAIQQLDNDNYISDE